MTMDNKEAIEILRKGYPDVNRYAPSELEDFDDDVRAYDEAVSYAISHLEADRWISVKDKLPEEETDVLVCNGKGDMIVCRGSRSTEIKDEFIWYVCDWRYGEITHWKPLPKAPESEAGNEQD